MQALALYLAHAVGRPTWYAAFALGSAAALVAATGGDPLGVAAAAVGTLLLAGLVALIADLWLLVLGPVVLTLLAGRATGKWAGVAAATLGAVLLIALALPLGLFILRQRPALVAEALASPAVHRMLWLSVYAPLLAAVASLAFGVPLAYLLRRGFPGREVVASLVDLPLVVPHTVAGLIVLFGFGEGAAFGDVRVLGTTVGLVAALTFVSAPYAVNAARDAFEGVDRRVEYAARAHGAGPVETFRRVTVPLAARGVLTGGVLAWARGVSEFGAVAVVAYSVDFLYPGRLPRALAERGLADLGALVEAVRVVGQHAPVYVYNVYTSRGLAASGAVAVVLLGLNAVVFLLVRSLAYGESRGWP